MFIKLQLNKEKKYKLAELERESTELITIQKSRKELVLAVAKSSGLGT